MNVELRKLATGTRFTHDGRLYEKRACVRNEHHCMVGFPEADQDRMLDAYGTDGAEFLCRPVVSGIAQHKIDCWLPVTTEVSI